LLEDIYSTFKVDIDFKIKEKFTSDHRQSPRLLDYYLQAVNNLIPEINPDFIIVHGDTTSAVAASVSGFQNRIPVIHIESGLRSGNLQDPWPEEINRRLIDSMSFIRFAPTSHALSNLKKEGLLENSFNVGNTVVDALNIAMKKIDENKEVEILRSKGLDRQRDYILFTLHRRENFGKKHLNIIQAIKELSNDGIFFVGTVHPNPHVQRIISDELSACQNVLLLPPQGYVDFIVLMKNSTLVMTDSGGIQEEAPSLNRLTLLTRNTTERPEGILAGTAFLIGTEKLLIKEQVLKNYQKSSIRVNLVNPFGDGNASKKIVNYLSNEFL
jgi:UDP-N-acetylglucosamine 2-epimerase (non-hydrolysing)